MELNIERIRNWYRHFGLISKEKDWHQIHVSGHGSGDQIKRVIDGSNAKLLIPIHTSTSEDENGKIVDNEDFDETTNTLMQLIVNTLQEQVKSTLTSKF